MAKVTINNLGNTLPTLLAGGGGFLSGIVLQKLINKGLSAEPVVSGLGAETVTGLKNYVTPIITTVIGASIALSADSKTVRQLGTGAALSGVVNCGMQFFWKKNLLSGMNDGIMGDLLGTDDDLDIEDGFSGYDDDDLDGYDDDDDLDGYDDDDDLDGYDDDDEFNGFGDDGEIELPVNNQIAALDIPSGVKVSVRDTPYEREHIEGIGYTPDGLVL